MKYWFNQFNVIFAKLEFNVTQCNSCNELKVLAYRPPVSLRSSILFRLRNMNLVGLIFFFFFPSFIRSNKGSPVYVFPVQKSVKIFRFLRKFSNLVQTGATKELYSWNTIGLKVCSQNFPKEQGVKIFF